MSRADHVLVFGNAPAAFLERLGNGAGSLPRVAADAEALREAVRDARPAVICAFKPAAGDFPVAALQENGDLKWLHIASAGIDHIAPWRRDDVVVTNSSGVHSAVLAEYVLCEILQHGLKTRTFDEQQRRAEWKPHDLSSCRGKTACIVGYGSVGGTTGELLGRLGMKVIAVTRSGRTRGDDTAAGSIPIRDLDGGLAEADYVVVTVPLTGETKGLIGASAFAAMKPGAYFVNISRGGIVDEDALCAALDAGALSGATCDVFKDEPLPPASPLWTQPGLRITPHTGDQEGWEILVADLFLENLQRFRQRRDLANVVNPALGY